MYQISNHYIVYNSYMPTSRNSFDSTTYFRYISIKITLRDSISSYIHGATEKETLLRQ